MPTYNGKNVKKITVIPRSANQPGVPDKTKQPDVLPKTKQPGVAEKTKQSDVLPKIKRPAVRLLTKQPGVAKKTKQPVVRLVIAHPHRQPKTKQPDVTDKIKPSEEREKTSPSDMREEIPPQDANEKMPPQDASEKIPPQDASEMIPPQESSEKIPPPPVYNPQAASLKTGDRKSSASSPSSKDMDGTTPKSTDERKSSLWAESDASPEIPEEGEEIQHVKYYTGKVKLDGKDGYFTPKRYYSRLETTEMFEMAQMDEMVTFNDELKQIIRDTWHQISSRVMKKGPQVFIEIFKLNKKIRSAYSFIKDAYDRNLETDERLIRHAAKFMEMVQEGINNLDNMDRFYELFINLGKHHIHYQDLNPDYLEQFSGAMVTVWRPELSDLKESNEKIFVAWCSLFEIMVKLMKHGYIIAKKEQDLKKAS